MESLLIKILELMDLARPQNGWDALIKVSGLAVLALYIWLRYKGPGNGKPPAAALVVLAILFGVGYMAARPVYISLKHREENRWREQVQAHDSASNLASAEAECSAATCTGKGCRCSAEQCQCTAEDRAAKAPTQISPPKKARKKPPSRADAGVKPVLDSTLQHPSWWPIEANAFADRGPKLWK